MRKKTLFLSVLFVAAWWLSFGCGAGIQQINPNPTPTPSDLPAIDDLQLVDGTVGTMTWTEPDDVASYAVTVTDPDGDQWNPDPLPVPCGSGNACEFPVLGMDREKTYTVTVSYANDAGDTSDDATLSIDTSWRQKTYAAPVAGQGFGTLVEVGNTGDAADPVPAILVGYDDDAATRPLLFAGGSGSLASDVTLEPYTLFFVNQLTFGNPIALGDVNCDGVDDVIVTARECADTFGRTYVFDGIAITAGADTVPDVTLTMPAVTSSLINNSAVTGFTDEDACETLWLGDPNEQNGFGMIFAGQLYSVYDPAGITTDTNVPNGGTALTNYSGAAVGNQVGRLAYNVGDVDGDGLDEILFNTAQVPLDSGFRITLHFSDEAADWGDYDSSGGPVMYAGRLPTAGQFYLASPLLIGARVSLFDGRDSLPGDPVKEIDSTIDSFGIGVAAGDINQQTPGLELLVGTVDSIYRYESFSVSASFNTDSPTIMATPGMNIQLIDFNEDGYLDIVSIDQTADPDGVLYINY